MKNTLVQILPFLLIIGFWIFIMLRLKKNYPATKQNEVLDVLKEIREELKELNKNNSEKKL